PRLAAGDVREQGRDRRNNGARDTRDRRWPRDDRDLDPGGDHDRSPAEYAPLRDVAQHHAGQEEAAREREAGGYRRRRRSAAQDLERVGAPEAQGRRDGEGCRGACEQAQERSEGDLMPALVIAEHDKAHLRGGTANAVTAALKMGGEVHVLVAGSGAKAAADAAAKLAGVGKVLHVDAAHYDGGGAENHAALVVGLAKGYSHVVASAS